ncbi:lysozyme [Rhodanobacter sp. MP7CTX1]|uniref:lysozyme n=1 Tax=Rhodanobacter sp. MP7CTX1 TaxID=2723084 RepID=UPI001609AF94|nr:lysozyme [Rhodanobacter sp. MP7CTX1]MBB6185766.1 lysozyme [Rhodanobacter sp. MP7CTX1]
MVKVEGERLVAYRDTNGTLTIGVGHTGLDVTPGLRITSETSRVLLLRDLAWATNCVSKNVHVALTEPQWIALVSFVFNEGEHAFMTSTLLRLLNAADYASVPTQLLRWTKETINGRLVDNAGLVNRRAAEAVLWNSRAGAELSTPTRALYVGAP